MQNRLDLKSNSFKFHSLKNKIVLITGNSRGIGKEISHGFLKNGSRVIGLSSGKEKKTIIKHKKYNHITCDLSDHNELKRSLDFIKKKFKKVDIIINNAAITLNLKKKFEYDLLNFKKTIKINLTSAYIISYYFAELMKAKKIKGNIINISSIGAILGFTNNPAYTSSKSGLLALTKSLAVDYGKYNITTNSILPGYFNIGMTEKSSKKFLIKKKRLNRILLKRYGKISELTNLILFLASDYSKYITGQEIIIDGGFSINSLN